MDHFELQRELVRVRKAVEGLWVLVNDPTLSDQTIRLVTDDICRMVLDEGPAAEGPRRWESG